MIGMKVSSICIWKKTLKYSVECIWLINQIMLNFSGLYMFMYRLITDNLTAQVKKNFTTLTIKKHIFPFIIVRDKRKENNS